MGSPPLHPPKRASRGSDRARVVLAAALSVVCTLGRQVGAQPPGTSVEPLTVSVVGPSDRARDPRADIALTLSRPLATTESPLVVLVGAADVSALVSTSGATAVLSPGPFALPAGEQVLTILQHRAGQWSTVATLPIRVQFRGGFTTASAVPSIDGTTNGQVAEGQSGGNAVAPPHRQDIAFTGGLRTTHTRPGLSIESQSTLVGATRTQQALRFGERGARAPQVDLSSYLVTVRHAATKLDIGHVSLAGNRHLAAGVASRGIALTTGPAWAQVVVGSVAAAPIVGWDDPLGVADEQHRISTAALNVELVKRRPGAVQVRLSALDGALRPRAGFAQGAVLDAEESRGTSVDVTAATAGQRARVSLGITRSSFTNPARDSQLTGGLNVRPSARDTRGARYLEGSLGIVPNIRLFGHVPAQLQLNVRHERVDPLFRSVGAFTQADREQNAVDLSGTFDVITWQATESRARDNLAAIASVLTSRTESRGASASFGMAPLLRQTQHTARWPHVAINVTRSHQFAESAPASNDFRPQDLADQSTQSADLSAQWQLGTWRANLRDNHSLQDNRQRSRERADFAGSTQSLSVGRALGARVDASVDAGLEQQRNRELAQVTRVRRVGVTTAWRVGSSGSLNANLSAAQSRTPPSASDVTNLEMRVEASQRVRLFGVADRARTAQLFVRFARTTVIALPFADLAAGALLPSRVATVRWTLNAGLSAKLW